RCPVTGPLLFRSSSSSPKSGELLERPRRSCLLLRRLLASSPPPPPRGGRRRHRPLLRRRLRPAPRPVSRASRLHLRRPHLGCQELDALPRLRHPHILGLLAFCDQQEEGVLVLEFAANGNLHERLHDQQETSTDGG
ncbi:unnamed protein product, partial [Urochloa humidicola]